MPIESPNKTFYSMTIVMFAKSLTIYKIFANQINCQQFDLENEGQGHRRVRQDLCHLTGNDSIFFQNFCYPATHLYAKCDTQRGVWAIAKGKICNALQDLPKTGGDTT